MNLLHLHYVTADNATHTIVASTMDEIRKGFSRICYDYPVVPQYIIIQERDTGKSYYIPQYQVFNELELKSIREVILLGFLYASNKYGIVSNELYDQLSERGFYKGDLTDEERKLLNNISIRFCKPDDYYFVTL